MKFGEWLEQFGMKYREYAKELTDAGAQTALDLYNGIDPRYGNDDVTVTTETENGYDYRIVASGEDVNFLEFGAGLNAGVRRPTVQANFEIAQGSWSRSEDGTGEFAKWGSWHWNKEKFYGSPALGGMQEACNTMQQQSPGIARRVFG